MYLRRRGDLTYNDGRYLIATVQQKTSTPPTPHFRKMLSSGYRSENPR